MKLRLTGPEGQLIERDLGNGTISIGRALDNDLIIADQTVSRHHCIISFDAGEGFAVLEEVKSRYGTSVNNQSLERSAVLSPDDRFSVGMWNGEVYDETLRGGTDQLETRKLNTFDSEPRATMRSTRKTRIIDGSLGNKRTTRLLLLLSGGVLLLLLLLFFLNDAGS